MIKQQFPQAISLLDLGSEFPKILSKELSWKMPLSFLLIIGVLFLYYRSWGYALLATVPFLSGTGLFVLSVILFKLNITFISLVGILMIYGFSIDYGIFSTDADNKHKYIWSALICAGLTTISGFTPLLFAQHPVLVQLGQVLFIGAVGTFIGAFWGIPFIKQVLKRKHEIAK
jgi:predicted exporter